MLYLWLKAAHIIAVISWLAGLLYLPRLYVYHVATKPGGEADGMLQTMEYRLLRVIVTPAMLASLGFGFGLLWLQPELLQNGWMHAKLGLIVLLLAVHGQFGRMRKQLIADSKAKRFRHSSRYYRWWNEAPTLIMIAIVVLVIVRPF